MSAKEKVIAKDNKQDLDLLDKIEKAQEQIQAMMIDSNFIKLTKEANVNSKEVNRNISIDVKKLCQKLDDDKITLRELNVLKRVFYLSEDKDSEVQLYNAKVDSKAEIIKSLINIRRYNLAQNLQNKNIEDKLIKSVQDNLEDINDNLDDGIGNQKSEVEVFQKDDVKIIVNKLKSSFEKEFKTFEKEVKNPKNKKSNSKIVKFLTVSEEKYRKAKKEAGIPLILKDMMNIDEEDSGQLNSASNNNQRVISTDVYTKKQINKVFKQNALEKISQNKAQIGNLLLNRDNFSSSINELIAKVNNTNFRCESVIEALAKNNNIKPIEAWNSISKNLNNFNDMITPLTGLIRTYIDNAPKGNSVNLDVGISMTIVNCIASVINKVGLLCQSITKIWQYLLNERQRDDFNIKIGSKSKKYEADALFKINRLAGYSNKGDFIQTDEWNKLSPFQKISARFKFSDINQFPSFKTWRDFNDEEKISFLVDRISKFRLNRAKELCEIYDKLTSTNVPDKIKLADMINKFVYYAKRDRNGNLITVSNEVRKKVVDKLKDKIKGYNFNCSKLITILNEFSKSNVVISIIKCRGKFYRCYGKDFSFIVDEKNFVKKIFKPKDRTYYKFKFGKHERQYKTKSIKFSQKRNNKLKKKLNYKYYNDFNQLKKSNSSSQKVNEQNQQKENLDNFNPKEDEFAMENDFVDENF